MSTPNLGPKSNSVPGPLEIPAPPEDSYRIAARKLTGHTIAWMVDRILQAVGNLLHNYDLQHSDMGDVLLYCIIERVQALRRPAPTPASAPPEAPHA